MTSETRTNQWSRGRQNGTGRFNAAGRELGLQVAELKNWKCENRNRAREESARELEASRLDRDVESARLYKEPVELRLRLASKKTG